MYVYPTFDGRPIECRKSDKGCFGCRIFDIRRTADRMSKIRHPKKGALDVEYSTFDGRLIECRKSDIRRRALRTSNIRHSTMRPIESKKSDPTNKANQIEFSTFDPTECTRLIETLSFFLTQRFSKRKDFMKIPKLILHIKPIRSHW